MPSLLLQVRYALSTETTQRTVDQPHQRNAAWSEGQATAPVAEFGEGSGAVQILPARRSEHQDQGHASVRYSSF